MSFDVGIARTRTRPPYPASPFAFDDDVYWFCHPFFEKLHDKTGEMIDLYGDAWFVGPQLDTLVAVLDDIAAAARAMPEQWDVCTGHSLGSSSAPTPPQPIYSTVRRDRVLELLDQFRDLALAAQRGAMWIACIGD